MKQYMADGMLLVTAIVWGSGFVITAIALEYLTAYQVMAGRFILAAIILTTIFGYRLKKASKSVIWKGIILGTILYIAFALQTVGLQYTTPSKNAFLTAVNVIVVPLIAYAVYKRRIDGYEIIGSIMAIVGIGFLSLQGSLTMNIGDALSLACAVAFAFDIFCTNLFVQKEDAIALTIIQFITASLLGILVVASQGDIPTTLEKEAIYSIIYLAIFSTTLAYLFQNVANQYTSATKAAIILSTESFFGMVLSVIFLHEVLTGRMVVGAILILLAILIAEVKPAHPKKRMMKSSR
ncbi:DMT family transporter [Lysinibacillus pakistanensis]|uniref:DMT family transporter n=1 Tax=Lysinibacillus pakistanensis TaxID=759811 RepID=A0AAX3WVM3_9BACI|nr:DMT family transporter [Lysinibacillus pakistanensis]MDM5231374.1 DMT family transporter [Lysinibacillus pakistanensis]WHY46922.1 DMT family transporter [Lysinibacillus pakistanensis]WHY51935.1 DMT family transporter [Lysinibacillus pakistanensis]